MQTFYAVGNPLLPLIDFFEAILKFFHDLGLGWGMAIVCLTLLIRMLLLPLTLKQFKSMQSMARLQPEIKKLQDRYKNDKERLNQEMMRFYQRVISPALPRRCKYHPTCSAYAMQAVERYGILRGAVLAGWRLLRCNPFSHGGYDPVSEQTLFRERRSPASHS